MNEKSGSFELLEPSPPEALVPDSWVEPWTIAAAVALLVVVLVVLIFKRKKAAPLDPLAMRRAAYAEATAALGEIDAVPARDAAVRSSLILRKYLSVAAGDPALFETHEETISRHDALKDFSEEARATAGQGFARLASLKYAAEIPDAAASEIVAESRALLETLHHGFRA
jgi:hypothetical protein